MVHFFKESLRQRPSKNVKMEAKRMRARIDPKESILDLSERTRRRQRTRNRCRTGTSEIRKMVAYDHVKPEYWYTAQDS